ncbi:inhibitor of apoptosis protein-like [Styela clava]
MDIDSNFDLEDRINTFSQCSSILNINENKLAKHGFAYNTTLNCTVCVGCKKTISGWTRTDQPCNMRFHELGCKFAQRLSNATHTNTSAHEGSPCTNQSIGATCSSSSNQKKFKHSSPSYKSEEGHPMACSLIPINPEHTIDHRWNRQVKSLPYMITNNPAIEERMEVEFPTEMNPLLNQSYSNSSCSREISLSQASTSREPRHSRPLNSNELTAFLAVHDMKIAKHRLETFKRFWSRNIVFKNVRLLVICGFFCLGQDDAVECFSCRLILANWSRDDNPQSRHRQLSPHCRFIRGEDCGAIPLPPQVRESDPSIGPQSRRLLHSTQTHITQSPEFICERQELLQLPALHLNPPLAAIERTNLLLEFPCINPANPAMREERARLRTLENPEFRRRTRLRASNERLAQAGMYYVGDGDRTKCWFCDGGLKDYLPEDDPWVEHTKYFPQCEYLLQQRGPGWVNEISAQNPDVARPILPVRERHILPNASHGSQSPSSEVSTTQHSSALSLSGENPQQRLLHQAMQSQAVQIARSMGFSEQQIRETQLTNININGTIFQTAESLVDALLHCNGATDQETSSGSSVQGISCSTVQITPQGTVLNLPDQTIHIVGGNITARSNISVPSSHSHNSPAFSEAGPSNSNNSVLVNGMPVNQYMNHVSHAPRNIQIEEGAGSNPAPPSGNGLAALGLDLPLSSPMRRMTRRPTTNTVTAPRTTSPSTSGNSTQRLAELERERTCKICLTLPADILFQPCGHICSCATCARRLYNCPVCRRAINRFIRTYHS